MRKNRRRFLARILFLLLSWLVLTEVAVPALISTLYHSERAASVEAIREAQERRSLRIVSFEVQALRWDFRAEPDDEAHGRVVDRWVNVVQPAATNDP